MGLVGWGRAGVCEYFLLWEEGGGLGGERGREELE